MSKKDLFSDFKSPSMPLAAKIRPMSIDEVIGQEHLMGEDGKIRKQIEAKSLKSAIFWGPPGCGKTTIAKLLAEAVGLEFRSVSAVFASVSDLRKIFDEAKGLNAAGRSLLLFVDEIHRFNKAQQDSFLPYVEDGTVVLVGATTENPSFRLNSALLSRCHVYVLNPFSKEEMEQMLKRAEKRLDKNLPLTEEARDLLIKMADGDARYLLNMVEVIFDLWKEGGEELGAKDLKKVVEKRALMYDQAGEAHYNLISALHKSLRGSDVQASLYWAARMLVSGEDPLYVLRRLTRFAVEDVGLSDPNALTQALNCWEMYERLGSPEGEIGIVYLVIYLANAPKSNSSYTAFGKVMREAKDSKSYMPPKHILNAPTDLMKGLGYGKGYQYDHDSEHGFSGQNYFPDEMGRREFYYPKEVGFEREIKKRMDYWENLRKKKTEG